MKRFAISDIHGCAHTFGLLLNKINFSQDDELYLLGDFIDRGPDSKGVFDRIFQLKTLGFNIHCLIGNHEEMLLESIQSNRNYEEFWLANGGTETLQSFNAAYISEIPEPYIRFIEAMPSCLVLDDFIFAHAGLNFNSPEPLEDKTPMRWIRDWYGDIDRQWLGDKIIVHGHTPIPENRIRTHILELKHLPVVNIDNGCVYERPGHHQLCALNLDTKELIFQPYAAVN